MGLPHPPLEIMTSALTETPTACYSATDDDQPQLRTITRGRPYVVFSACLSLWQPKRTAGRHRGT